MQSINMNKKYYIVEFNDGLQIIPNNWFTCDKKSAVYWPNLTNQKEYDKAVEKMKDFNNNDTKIIPVERIFASTDIFIKAKDKLKLAEKLSDLNSDEDTTVLKKRRRLYASKVLSSSSEEEIDDQIDDKEIDNYPKVPLILKNDKSRRILQDKTNYQYSSEQKNEMQIQLTEKEKSNFTSDIFKKNDGIGLQNIQVNKNISHGSTSKVQHDPTTEFNEFKHYVYKNFAILKQKLDLILQNQSDFMEQWDNHNVNYTQNDETINIMSQFPIENDNNLNQLEEALIDNNYRNKLVNELSKIGGKNMKQFALNIIKRVFTVNIAKEYSWYGKKNNKNFSSLQLCSIIINAIQMKYPQATEYEISDPIKTWLRHASQKAQKNAAD